MTQQPLVSPHDGVGTNLYAHVLRGKVMRVVPRPNESINETWIADRDRFSYEGIYSADRLQAPMLRDGDTWKTVGWDVALNAAAEALKDCGGSLGVVGSPSATTEELYLLARLARGLGTADVDHRLRMADFRDGPSDPVAPVLGLPIAEIEGLSSLLVVGSNLRCEVPMLAHRVRKAARRGAKVGFLNPLDYRHLFPVAATLVSPSSSLLADLIGVPEEDRQDFLTAMLRPKGGTVGGTGGDQMAHNPLAYLYERFSAYVEDRRLAPRDDVLTGLATATFPDGTLPEVIDAVRVATILFAAGHESSTRFLTSALMILGDHREVQAQLRADLSLIPNFIEEALRFESVVKGDFRLTRVPTEVAGVAIPAGTNVMLLHGAANRDPRKFEDPGEFKLDRANARQHIAFGRGIHTCPGAPLVRSEAAIAIRRLLERTDDIRISEKAHGPAGARDFRYLPTFVLRGLATLTLEFDPKATR
jgi:hypothetical protein